MNILVVLLSLQLSFHSVMSSCGCRKPKVLIELFRNLITSCALVSGWCWWCHSWRLYQEDLHQGKMENKVEIISCLVNHDYKIFKNKFNIFREHCCSVNGTLSPPGSVMTTIYQDGCAMVWNVYSLKFDYLFEGYHEMCWRTSHCSWY